MRNAGLAYDEIRTDEERRRKMIDKPQSVSEVFTSTTSETAPMSGAAQPSEQDSTGLPDEFTAKLIAALKTIYDPEIPVDIFELGLIYKIDVADNKDVAVEMTLTAPGCPIAGEMPVMVEEALKLVEGIGTVTVNMTFDPPWTMDKMSEEARVALNMF
jgi:FeS assembly SUF system protein